MSRGKLRPEDEIIVQKNYEYLKSQLEASDLLDNLFQNEVITLEDKIRINSGRTKSDRNEDLLLTILHSGPGASFSCFLLSLQAKYPHVYKQLERKDGVLQETTGETDGLKIEVDKIEIMVKHKNCAIQQLKDKCEHLSKQLREFKVDGAQKDVKIEKLNEEIKVVTADRAQKDAKIEHLNKQLTEVTAERDEALEQLMEFCDNNKELQTSLDFAKIKILQQSKLIEIMTEANRIDTKFEGVMTWKPLKTCRVEQYRRLEGKVVPYRGAIISWY